MDDPHPGEADGEEPLTDTEDLFTQTTVTAVPDQDEKPKKSKVSELTTNNLNLQALNQDNIRTETPPVVTRRGRVIKPPMRLDI